MAKRTRQNKVHLNRHSLGSDTHTMCWEATSASRMISLL
jgi:hypothetical protein